jgi:hypothetical protein
VDEKRLITNGKKAFSLVRGFLRESDKKYNGALAAGSERDKLQIIVRLNREF